MRRIPDDNLSYPISVFLAGGGQGTGFLVNSNPYIYFVTAKHVLVNRSGGLASNMATLTAYNRVVPGDPAITLELNLVDLQSSGALRTHSSQDIAVIRIATLSQLSDGSFTLSFAPGVSASNPSGANLIGIDLKHHAKRYADVLEANDIIVFGYPTSLGVPSQPQLDLTKPLLRHGIVAAKNAALRTIILDCPIYPGNSGGPVLEIEFVAGGFRYSTIGVVVEFVPAAESWVNRPYGYENLSISNSGYSVAVPIDAIDEVLASY